MKKITKIEYQKNNKDRVNIFLNDEFGFGLDLNIMIKYSLSKNMELGDEFISEILIAEDKNKAYNYAISILSRRAKSEKELRLKMSQKGYENEYIDFTIDKLKQNKYIDDSDYSERFIRDKLSFSKYGKLKVREALYNKGIDKQIIDEKLNLISSEDEFKRSYELAEKKLKSLFKLDSQKRRIKLYNFLINKGFEYDTVKKVVSELLKEEHNGFDD